MKTTKTNNFKTLVAAGLIAGLAATTLAQNVDTLVKANDDSRKIEVKAEVENTKAVSASVVEKDSKVFVVVKANADVSNAVVKVSVDGIRYDNMELGTLAKDEVREIELDMPEAGEVPVKTLPNTAAVSDSVDFSKEVQGHKVKGSVSFVYDNGVVETEVPTELMPSVVTPDEPVKPVIPLVTPIKPIQPVVPEIPVNPNKPVNPVTPEKPEVTPEKPEVTPEKPEVTPEKPEVTPEKPEVTPNDPGLEAGMPANVKWSRAQLKEWGFTFGKITGNYDVDGDLGVFDNEDDIDRAWKDGSKALDKQYLDGKIDDAYYKNTPHGYSWNSVTKADGTRGYTVYLYDNNGVYNDGQKAR